MSKLKVFGGLVEHHAFPKPNKRTRVIVAAASRAAARRALAAVGITLSDSELRDYWNETGNERELATALPHEGAVFYAVNLTESEYARFIGTKGQG
ncbi:hypothetical protein [Burkholderia ubonensis]|uniref:Uncharacterized protein n=1 Tax=Burkholderia ubonensis TaxID=101571 RepID=A0ABD4DZK3_9BURK|nr:hypothetical protein [Burkholderia ubonensis]KVN83413.1 hypothetical protein WJ68_15980 [Burkholderia ubonensis]